MNTKTGQIVMIDDVESIVNSDSGIFIRMALPPTQVQILRGRVAKYEPCPCGSGKKFKFCCFLKK